MVDMASWVGCVGTGCSGHDVVSQGWVGEA